MWHTQIQSKKSELTDIYTASTVGVAVELPDLRLIVNVPDRDRTVRAAAEAHLTVRTDGERIAGRRLRCEFGLDARRGRAEIPDWDYARLTADDQRTIVRQQFAGSNVIITLQTLERADRQFCWAGFWCVYIPDFYTAYDGELERERGFVICCFIEYYLIDLS